MPHRCAGCKTLFPDARQLRDGCPVCGCGKFVFETGRRRETDHQPKETSEPLAGASQQDIPVMRVRNGIGREESAIHDSRHTFHDPDAIESIRILEPGRYDLNLSRLAESDDRVVRVGSEDTYRLDLHSMIRQKKKK